LISDENFQAVHKIMDLKQSRHLVQPRSHRISVPYDSSLGEWDDVDLDLDEVGVDTADGSADCLVQHRGTPFAPTLLSYQKVTTLDVTGLVPIFETTG
jgi:hypothetical protein